MDYSINIDTIRMELFILYFKGLQVKTAIKICTCISVSKDCNFAFLTNNVDSDEMLHVTMSFHLVSSLFAKVSSYRSPK